MTPEQAREIARLEVEVRQEWNKLGIIVGSRILRPFSSMPRDRNVIPAEAVEAAHEQLDAMGSYVPRKYLAAALEAAAPHMLADAWRLGLDAGRGVETARNPYSG